MNEAMTIYPKPLRMGSMAPDFRARSTMGDFQLSAQRGHWVIFFSHPADFTPVCSTEFVALARRQADFDALDCRLIGLSVDSLYAHIAWVRALRDLFGVDVAFPILEDPSMAIGRAYGMIDDDAADSMTMRSTFFIDPQGVIRATTAYPHNVGRSVDEMLRLLRALQWVDGEGGLTPEGWTAGQPALLSATESPCAEPDWFCRFENQ
ncbi:redoxin domain-containing protein [Novosphingobium sp. SL115]|uniref:peroxiredoxin n=1 Tax=Novosphingobium sp. SL115 TaxID=2995150 RepID=UPI002274628B|nr:redoxin domain-containing protein [Novosphingobium sp. SL115]MCY1671344.1 redoxin domain-containing protein [Novosphingobium sp. SL115]